MRCDHALWPVTPQEVDQPLARLGSVVIESRGRCPGSAYSRPQSFVLDNTANTLYSKHMQIEVEQEVWGAAKRESHTDAAV